MHFHLYTPFPPLGDFVQDLWLYEDYAPPSHLNERIVPSGTIELVINLQENELRIYDTVPAKSAKRFAGALVSGTYSKSFVSDVAEEKSIMGVHFKPAGAFPFLGISPDTLADRHINLEQLWGRAARDLRDRLSEATSPRERFQILEAALLQNLSRPLHHHWAVPAVLHEFAKPGTRPLIREIARDLGLSQKRLISVFAAETGITPKLFGRIQRFHRAMNTALEARGRCDWSQVALSCGYCDQAHLISDFVEFSGLTPEQYLGEIRLLSKQDFRRKRNHIPVLRAA